MGEIKSWEVGQRKIRISEDTDLCRFLFPLLCPLQRQRQRLAKHDAAQGDRYNLQKVYRDKFRLLKASDISLNVSVMLLDARKHLLYLKDFNANMALCVFNVWRMFQSVFASSFGVRLQLANFFVTHNNTFDEIPSFL